MPHKRKPNQRRSKPAPATLDLERVDRLALSLRELAPWNWMTPAQIFGVQDPSSGQRAWVQVHAGSCPGVSAFLGDASHEQLLRRRAGELQHEDELHDSDQLILMLDPDPRVKLAESTRPTLRQPDSKDAAAPALLLHQRPGCPAGAPQAQDAERMAGVLEQLLELSPRLRVTPGLLDAQHPEGWLVRVPEATSGGLVWHDTRISTPTPDPIPVAQPDPEHLEYLGAYCCSFEGTLDCDVFFLPIPWRERGRHHDEFMVMFALLDPESGMILFQELLHCGNRWAEAQAALLHWIEQLQRFPERLRVRRRQLHAVLAPLAEHFGMQLELAAELPDCDVLQNDMSLHFQSLGPRHPLFQEQQPRRRRARQIKKR